MIFYVNQWLFVIGYIYREHSDSSTNCPCLEFISHLGQSNEHKNSDLRHGPDIHCCNQSFRWMKRRRLSWPGYRSLLLPPPLFRCSPSFTLPSLSFPAPLLQPQRTKSTSGEAIWKWHSLALFILTT